MTVAIIDYGSGNLHSARKAFERAAQESGSRSSIVVTSDPDVVAHADHIVLPGVGAFADCRRGLDAATGMTQALKMAVIDKGRPFLGICVGMQLLATCGREHVTTAGLDWIPGEVVPLQPSDPALKVPHMGWNTIALATPHPLFNGIATGNDGLHAYFVHSYHLSAAAKAMVLATADYGGAITAVVGRDNIVGTQFHPEKSQKLGLGLIGNFLRWTP